jgi:hypothetical protein
VTREAGIEGRCRKLAAAEGWLLLKLWPMGAAGIPDRILLRPGARVDFIEFKQPGEKLTIIQQFWAARLGALGFSCHRIDSVAGFRNIFQIGVAIS